MIGDQLECAYHGWRFDRNGHCALIPAVGPDGRIPGSARADAAWGVTERYGLIWIAPQEPVVPLIDLPDWDDPSRTQVEMEVHTGRYGAALLIDNQLDMAHFAFLHAGTFGTPDGQIAPTAEIVGAAWGFTVNAQIPITAGNDPAALRGERPTAQYRKMTYRYQAPFSLELRLDYPIMGGSTLIWFFAQPETEDRCSLHTTLSFQQPGGFSAAQLNERLKFEHQILAEDMDLQARFEDLSLPLGPGAETHTRADRPSIEYRRILRDILSNVGQG